MRRLMVIDDSKSVHAFVRECLKGTGWEIVSAYDGEQGIALLSGGAKIDLILLDWEMPVMNGPLTFEKLKGNGFPVPVIMMTARNTIADIEKMIAAGVSEYVMKPFTKDILTEKIESVFSKVGLDEN